MTELHYCCIAWKFHQSPQPPKVCNAARNTAAGERPFSLGPSALIGNALTTDRFLAGSVWLEDPSAVAGGADSERAPADCVNVAAETAAAAATAVAAASEGMQYVHNL